MNISDAFEEKFSEADSLLKDRYDLMIDRFIEYRRLFRETPVRELAEKIKAEYNCSMDTKFCFYLVEKILEFWMDMEEDYYPVLASWVIGTFFFASWVSYPYLFINAVKASGKTRLLKLLAFLTGGKYTMSLKEAVLFRYPTIKKKGLFIDETEQISGREKSDLRELLLVAYKKGGTVMRMRKNLKTEQQELDEFEIFVPIAMANIGGMDDVLGDRCLNIILERSYDKRKTSRPEVFDMDEKITLFKHLMYDNSLVTLMTDDVSKNIVYLYDTLCVTNVSNVSNVTNVTNVTNDTQQLTNIIIQKGIVSRDFELWSPLIITNQVFCGDSSRLIDIAAKFTKDRQATNVMEDRDTSMMIFLAKFTINRSQTDWISYNELCSSYNENEGIDSKSRDAMKGWILSRILKRLKIVVDKRHLSTARQVLLDFDKIQKNVARLGIEIDKEEAIEATEDQEVQSLITDEDFGADET